MFIKYVGGTPRKNSFGIFMPGKVYDVAPHIGKELLKVSIFIESDEEGNIDAHDLAKTNEAMENILEENAQMKIDIHNLLAENEALKANQIPIADDNAEPPIDENPGETVPESDAENKVAENQELNGDS